MNARILTTLLLALPTLTLSGCQMDAAWLEEFSEALVAANNPGATPVPAAAPASAVSAGGGFAQQAAGGIGAAGAGAAAGVDPNLCGSWSRTESMSSGDFSMATRHFLVVRPDGTYTLGTGDMVGGGSMGSLASRGNDSVSGRWKAEGGIVHVQEYGAWQPFARYYVEAGKLMFTFGDGSREVWYR